MIPDKQEALNNKLIIAKHSYSILFRKKNSIMFNVACLFGLRSKTEIEASLSKELDRIQSCNDELGIIKSEIEKLEDEIDDISTDIEKFENSYSDLSAEQSILNRVKQQTTFYEPLKKYVAAMDCEQFIASFDCIQELFEQAGNLIDENRVKYPQYSDMSRDELCQLRNSLEHEINSYSPQSAETRINNCLVLGLTIDACIKRLSPKSYRPRHVFLDEAAYCPLIKAGVLTSFSAPITLLGDHMQLPPVCELNATDLNKSGNEPLVLWMQSSVYLDSIECLSIQDLKRQYDRGEMPNFSVMHLSFLSRTFRYGSDLARILARSVYGREVEGSSEHGTEITFIDSGVRRGNGNSSESEAAAILDYISSAPNGDFAVLTPYRDQVRALLSMHLPRDSVYTVHRAQGQEWDTVILSVVTEHPRWFTDSNTIVGKKLLNTAVSRARKRLVIVLDWSGWKIHRNQLITELCNSKFLEFDYAEKASGINQMAEEMIWMEAWDGSPVRVPASKAKQYAAAQKEIKERREAGNTELTPEEKAFAALLAKGLSKEISKQKEP